MSKDYKLCRFLVKIAKTLQENVLFVKFSDINSIIHNLLDYYEAGLNKRKFRYTVNGPIDSIRVFENLNVCGYWSNYFDNNL